MSNEWAIENTTLGILYRVVGANCQHAGLRVGDFVVMEEEGGKHYRHNITRKSRVLFSETNPGVWVVQA
jgi:hypothetical protein